MNLAVIISAFVCSSFLHLLVQRIFIHYKKFDKFNHRSTHKTSATLTGGVGVFLNTLLISLYFYFNKIDLFDYSLFIPLSIMFIVGVYDDFYNADFKLKFLLQIIVAKILIDQGYVITNYHGLFGLGEVSWLWAQLTSIFVFLLIVNAFNFIDGIDGLAITQTLIVLFLVEFFGLQFTALAPLAILFGASLIPLYFFNFKKERKVFLGDGGSLMIGTLISTYVFYVLSDSYSLNFNKTLFVVLILIYPLADLLRVFVIRIKNRTSPFKPDQNHLHHLLLKKGFSHLGICLTLVITYALLSSIFFLS
jgi:UDP-GlcNAc:undecaprenyl-phosphate GlcNAc-1-phosphate transferase